MSLSTFCDAVLGQWRGEYKLWLEPSKDPAISATSMVIKPTANGSYYLIHYDWQFKDKERAGIFLLAGKEAQVQATWGDSFHMEPLPMVCNGDINEEGVFLPGTYPAGDQVWGWRTEFTHNSNELIMRAYNIWPTGQEDIAVEAIYQRNAK